MKLRSDNKFVQLGLTLFFTAIAIMLAFFFLYRHETISKNIAAINKILAPIIYGLILAYIMTPLLNYIEVNIVNKIVTKFNLFKKSKARKKAKNIRTISILLTLIVVFSLLYLFFVSVIPEIYKSIQNIISHYSSYTNNLIKTFNKLMNDYPEINRMFSQLIYNYSSETDDWLNENLLPTISAIFPNISDVFGKFSQSIFGFISFIWNIVIGLIISIYVLGSKEKFARSCTKIIYALFENKTANKILVATRFTHHKFIGFLSGKVVDSLIIGIICFICLSLLKMPYALLVSLIIGVTNIIPFFGPWFGAIPSAVIILMVNPKKALVFVVFVMILQQLDGNVIGPKILSESTGVSSFWIIVSITIFGGLFGVPGMIIGVPVIAVIFGGLTYITNTKLEKKNLPTEEEFYTNVGEISDTGQLTEYVYVKPPKKKPGKMYTKIGKTIKNIFQSKKESKEE